MWEWQGGTEIDTLSLDTGQLSHVRSSCGDELDSPTYSPGGGWIAYTVYSEERSEIAFSSVFGASSQIAPPAGLGADLPRCLPKLATDSLSDASLTSSRVNTRSTRRPNIRKSWVAEMSKTAS